MSFVACDLDKTKLPTERDVMQYLMFVRDEKNRSARQNVGFRDVITSVSGVIAELWNQAGIPIISSGAVFGKLASVEERHRSVVKTPSKYVAKDWDRLFKICLCHCNIEHEDGLRCQCTPHNKIPNNAIHYYIDQCGPRLLTFDSFGDAEGDAAVGGAMADVLMDDAFSASSSGIGQPSSTGYCPSEGEIEDFTRSQREQNPPSDDEGEEQRLNVTKAALTSFCMALDR